MGQGAPTSGAVDEAHAKAPAPASLLALAQLFLRLGLTAFGGPAAHVAMMESEVVRRRRWLTPERFLDLMGAANLIPGPSSSELAIFIGYEKAGLLGLVVAGVCFVLPAALLTAVLAWAYVRYGALPRASGLLYGIKPVVIAIVAQALWGLFPKAVKRSRGLFALGILACVASALGVDAVLVLLGAGALSVAARWLPAARDDDRRLLLLAPIAAGKGLTAIFLAFLKLGAIVFGSGYVLLAFLRSELIERRHWLTEAQLIDAVAVGQVTPGPVFTTATFLGYLLGGGKGAAVATIGIFLPGFVLVALVRPLVDRVRRSTIASAFLDGVNVASLALMAVVTMTLLRAAVVDGLTIALALGSAILLLRFKVGSTWLIVGAGVIGALARSSPLP